MPAPLKVTHVVLSLDVGGLERVVLDLLREAPRLGQEASILCLERPGTMASEAEALGASVACVEKPPGLPLGVVGRIGRLLDRWRPEVVHTHQIGPLLYAGPAARRAGVPAVLHTEHGKHYAEGLDKRWLGRLAGRYADRFLCVSGDIAEAVRAHRVAPGRKLHVARNGIDTGRYAAAAGEAPAARRELGIPGAAPVVGTVGRLDEVKRQDVLLHGFARLHRQLPESHLLLVGDGPLRGELQALAEALELGPWVHFAGYQPRPERYLAAMNVFTLTSRSEGMPLSVLEAWAAGVPVVASRVGGLPELVEDGRTGLLVDFGAEDALAETLAEVLGHPGRARALAKAGRDRVESEFSLHRMAVSYHQHYLNVVESSRNRNK